MGILWRMYCWCGDCWWVMRWWKECWCCGDHPPLGWRRCCDSFYVHISNEISIPALNGVYVLVKFFTEYLEAYSSVTLH